MPDDELTPIQPKGWKKPRGYSNGMLAPLRGRMLFIAGQIAWNEECELVGRGDFLAQFTQALQNVIAVVRAAGGHPRDLARMTIFVTDKQLYLERTSEIGESYRDLMGDHYPAMTLVKVADLLEPGALIEIEATALLRA